MNEREQYSQKVESDNKRSLNVMGIPLQSIG